MIDFIPLEILTKPKTGMVVIVDSYWIIHPKKGAAFFKRNDSVSTRSGSPQCNRDLRVITMVRNRTYPEFEIRQIPLAFVESNHSYE